MEEALELARRGVGRTSPNPAVGAVLVNDGEVVGRGYHTYAQVKHAEILALDQAGDTRPRRHALRHARAVRASWPHATVRGCLDCWPA